MPDLLNVNHELLEHADYDEPYALWLQRLADACHHFVNVDLLSIIDNISCEVTPLEMYLRNTAPELFFKNTVLSVLEVDYGVDYIEELVHDNVMWGVEHG